MSSNSVTRRYHFEAGHFLPKVHDGHKCKRPHGHNYVVEFTVEAPIMENGFIIDFWDLDKVIQPIIDIVDHRMLNDIPGLENPTAELIADWFMSKLGSSVVEVRVYETPDCWAVTKR